MEAFKQWPEKTLTSPEGCHLGHYKVWLLNHKEEFTKDTEDTPDQERGDTDILTGYKYFSMITKILNLCVSLGHPLQSWSRVHMILAPKDQTDSPRLERIRMINQLDCRLNLLRRILISKKDNAKRRR